MNESQFKEIIGEFKGKTFTFDLNDAQCWQKYSLLLI